MQPTISSHGNNGSKLHYNLMRAKMLKRGQYHSSIIHGTHLFAGIIPLLPLLSACRLFRSHPRLLRGIRYSQLLFTSL